MPSDGPFMGLAGVDKRATQFEGSMAAGSVPLTLSVCVCVARCCWGQVDLGVRGVPAWLAGNFPRLNSFNNVRHIKSSCQLAKSLRASRRSCSIRTRSKSRQGKILAKTMAKAKDERQREGVRKKE